MVVALPAHPLEVGQPPQTHHHVHIACAGPYQHGSLRWPALLEHLVPDARPRALLALAPAAVMRAYLQSPAFLALALAAPVRADSRRQTLIAGVPSAVVLAYLRSPKFSAVCLAALVGADV